MANEIEEIRYQVGEAWKGGYNAETPYGVAAVVQDPTGLSVYRSLKNGNTGHPLTDANWWFCIIDMSSIKQEGDALNTLDQRVTESENERVEAESERVSAEQGREHAESERVSSESERVDAESGRKSAENTRVSSENARTAAETTRANAESGRVSAENARVLAENLRDAAESERAVAENNRAAAERERHTQYTADHSAAVSDHSTAQLDHTTAVADHEQASTDHTASVEATDEASNVNAEIDGLVVTITDRNGQSHSVNIGFDIAGTYASVAAMNADAANVQEGAFVMIATSDPTSTENARLYVRNSNAPTSSEPFTFLSDLDQASSAAWADWLENYKPTINADHQRAETDHATAAADHTVAVSDHNTATTDHTQAASDHSTAASDHTAAASDHTRAESDHTTAAADHTQAESDHQRAESDHSTMEDRFESIENNVENLEEKKANKDGYYSQMTVGSAENLVGQTVDSEAYLVRATGGESNEVANGVASVIGMEGHTEKFNQLVAANTTSVLLTNGHKYYTKINSITSVVTGTGTNINVTGGIDIVINLTAIFGQGNEPSTVAEFEAWLAKNVGLKPYYGYNAGSLLSAQTLGIKTYGQNLLNPTTRQAKLIPYEWEDNSNVYTIKNVPSGATATYTPDSTGVAETVDISGGSLDITSYGSGILELSAATAETYVCMKWDEGKDDDVVPFEEHTQEFDVRKVYGKVNGAGEYVQCFPNGMKSAGTVHDSLNANEAVSKIGSVNLGSLNWQAKTTIQSGKMRFEAALPGVVQPSSGTVIANLLCTKYNAIGSADAYSNVTGISAITVGPGLSIYDENFANESAESFKAALQGVTLYYELATPITYTDLIYRDGGIDTPITDVLFNINVNNWSIEEQLMTPYEDGNPTSIPAIITTNYGMDAVEEIDTIKHTYVSAYNEQEFSDSQKAQARRNIGAVEANGSYPDMSVGLAKNLAGENTVEAEYIYRQSGGAVGTDTGIANVTTVKGETLVWNQLCKNDATFVANFTTLTDGVYTCTPTSGVYCLRDYSIPTNNGHKYYVAFTAKSDNEDTISFNSYHGSSTNIPALATVWTRYDYIITNNNTNDFGFASSNGLNFSIKEIVYIDLTQMFGEDKEPSTVEEFEALYPLDYYDYNAGELVSNNASAIETTGFNQWDEEWKVGVLNGTGSIVQGDRICSKNLIPVIAGQIYHFRVGSNDSQVGRYETYDSSGNLVQYVGSSTNTLTIPEGVAYIRFCTNADYGTTYNHDICINLNDPAKNGTYEPYQKNTFYFDKVLQGEGSLATIKGKLNGEGESVVVFPDGLRKAGNVFDEIKGNVAIKRIGSVDLGSLSWTKFTGYNSDHTFLASLPADCSTITSTEVWVCSKYVIGSGVHVSNGTLDKAASMNNGYFPGSNPKIGISDTAYTDAATFKTAMSGVILYYELETPETYILDQTVTGGYQVNANGTERRLPEDTASSVNAPVNYSVIYPINAVGTLIKLPVNYISEKSLTNFTTELASKLGTFLNATIGITATYNQTNQEYDYSITITANE